MSHKNYYFYSNIALLISAIISVLSSGCIKSSGFSGLTGGAVLATEPANGNRRADPNAPIKIEFSEDLNPSSLEKRRFVFWDETLGIEKAGIHDVAFDLKIDGPRAVSLVPTTPLVPGHSYSITVAGLIVDGVSVQKAHIFKFRTWLSREIFTATVKPADHSTDVPLSTLITIEFSEAPDKATVTRKTLSSDPYLSGDIEWKGDRQIVIRNQYSAPLFERGTTYTLKLEGITTPGKAKELMPISTSFSSASNLLLQRINGHEVNGRDTVLGQISHTNEIHLSFDAPIDFESFQKPGAFELTSTSDDGHISQNVHGTIKKNPFYKDSIIFTASQDYPTDSKIYLKLAATVADKNGFTLGKPLTIRLR